MEGEEQPTRPEAARPAPPTPPRAINPDREARRLNRQAADALKKLRLAVEEEPAFVFRP